MAIGAAIALAGAGGPESMAALMALHGAATGVGAAFRAVFSSAQAVRTSFDNIANASKSLANAIAPFVHEVGKWNPGTFDRMNLAFDNLAASTGRIWEPLAIAATNFANNLNEAFTAIGPPIRELVDKFAGLATEVGTEIFAAFFRIVEAGMPVINNLLDDLRRFMPDLRYLTEAFVNLSVAAIRVGAWFAGGFLSAISSVVSALQFFDATIIASANVFSRMIEDLKDPIGAVARLAQGITPFTGFADDVAAILARFQNMPPGQLPGGQGRTLAAEPARHVSIEDVGMEARRQAFSQGQDVQQQQLAAQQQLVNMQREMLNLFRQFFPQIANLFGQPPLGLN